MVIYFGMFVFFVALIHSIYALRNVNVLIALHEEWVRLNDLDDTITDKRSRLAAEVRVAKRREPEDPKKILELNNQLEEVKREQSEIQKQIQEVDRKQKEAWRVFQLINHGRLGRVFKPQNAANRVS